jgi:Spy/CpxP family protein refolding chaperone
MSFGISGVTSVTSSLNLLSVANSGTGAQPPPDPFSDPNGPFSNLNLTADQKKQIGSILSTAKSQGLSFSQINSQISQVLTPQQQQTFQTDLQQAKAHHHHRGGGSSSDSSSLLSKLDLSSSQQTQIGQLVQNAQSNGTSPSTLLSQINNLLTSSQQSQLSNLLSSSNQTSAYTPSGSGTTNNQPYLVNTAA